MTPRRLLALILALPPEAAVWASQRAAEEKAKIPAVDKIRERQEYYRARGH